MGARRLGASKHRLGKSIMESITSIDGIEASLGLMTVSVAIDLEIKNMPVEDPETEIPPMATTTCATKEAPLRAPPTDTLPPPGTPPDAAQQDTVVNPAAVTPAEEAASAPSAVVLEEVSSPAPEAPMTSPAPEAP